MMVSAKYHVYHWPLAIILGPIALHLAYMLPGTSSKLSLRLKYYLSPGDSLPEVVGKYSLSNKIMAYSLYS